jgi:hypothetical protein
MSVQFEEENNFNESFKRRAASSGSGGITNWLLKNKFAKNEAGANKIMIVATIICFAVAIYFAVK